MAFSKSSIPFSATANDEARTCGLDEHAEISLRALNFDARDSRKTDLLVNRRSGWLRPLRGSSDNRP